MSRRREILGPFYALIGILAVSMTLVAVSIHVSRLHERALRDKLERFHFRSAMLTLEAIRGATKIEWAQASDREIGTALYSIAQALDSLVELHDDWRQPADPFSSTLARATLQYRELREFVAQDPRSIAEITQRAAALDFTLFQLDRLHSIAAREQLDRITATQARDTRRAVLMIGSVLFVAGMLVFRVLFLLRLRLREHEQTEHALLENERQLRQSSKMEALGSLAGGVAHDFNNLLTAILGNAELLQGEHATDAGRDSLREIRKAVDRAAGLTRQLLTFSRKQPTEPRVVDINALIRDLTPMLRRLIREDIALEVQLLSEHPRVEVDPVQIEQVMINLAVNARDAMDEGGLLTVRTSDVRRVDAGMRDFVRICVEDTGSGMEPEVISRVFDPFFTTKEPGRGTGLGLSTVHGVVTKSGGHVQVQSEIGGGSHFEVDLPRCATPTSDRRGIAERPQAAQGTETVLVAEDEPQILSLSVTGLRQAGYQVLEARDGAEALRLCASHRGPLHLILTDVVMPEMGGPELVERAQELHPDVRALYFSGYAPEESFNSGSADVSLLAKPFEVRELLSAVRRELDTPRDDSPF